jgi:hypothetical protein
MAAEVSMRRISSGLGAVLPVVFLGCATSGGSSSSAKSTPHEQHVAPAPMATDPNAEAMGGGGEASGPEHEAEVVRSGKSPYSISWQAAQARYNKGNKCYGRDAPDAVIGPPDQKNEMTQGRTKVVTYGFRFREGTLMIRCRADHVETTRVLK